MGWEAGFLHVRMIGGYKKEISEKREIQSIE